MNIDGSARLEGLLGDPGRVPSRIPWEESAERIGLEFPADYRRLVDVYGSIRFGGDLSIWVPSGRTAYPGYPNGFEGFVHDTAAVAEELELAYEDDPDEIPYLVCPSTGGLLAWGGTGNGERCFWLVTDLACPDEWPVVIWFQEIGQWDRFEGGIAEFLLALIDGEYAMAGELLAAPAALPWTPCLDRPWAE
ncbi:hypothetical protein ACFV6F_17715 [Kitasatospora phosalacinea]|uniref:hypothetical protein n=1 Tax=Kitasatospora phosalacinea TaxID=2065 RepID=UPI0036652FAE